MSTIYSKAYLLTKVLTASKREIVLYLYEGALGHLRQAAEAREEDREATCGEELDRAVSILIELSSCLDYDHNGDLALKLDGIYNYMIDVLTRSGKCRDIEPIKASESMLAILCDAWRQAIAIEQETEEDAHQSQLQISA